MLAVVLLLIINTLVVAEENSITSASVSNQANLTTPSLINNMNMVSETKINLNVTWYPVLVQLVDKEYNITVQNLESKQRNLNVGAFFKALTKDIDTIVPGSVQLSYITNLIKVVDNDSTTCKDKQVVLSQGQSNQTTKTVQECTTQNNPTTVTYKGWKAYPVNEVRDKLKQEIILQKTNENGKITLPPNSVVPLNLKFKTKIVTRPDGTFGNDGVVGLKLDNESFHPPFNVSYSKRYLVNVTADDAIDTNYTLNITFAFTGNSNEIGTGVRASTIHTSSVLACNNVHVIFNETTELDREIFQCNTSNFQLLIRNPVNITRNGVLLNSIEIYYDPIGNNYQPPRDYSAIFLPGSDHWDSGPNTSRWIYTNASSSNGSWINLSNSTLSNGVVRFQSTTEAGTACIQANTADNGNNITQDNWQMQFEFIRDTIPTSSNTNVVGLNDQVCTPYVDPNGGGCAGLFNANGIFWGNEAGGVPGTQNLRHIKNGSCATSVPKITRQIPVDTVAIFYVNTTASVRSHGEHFDSGVSSGETSVATLFPSGVTKFVRIQFRPEGGAYKVNYTIDNLIIQQLVRFSPSFTVFQENKSFSAIVNVRACTAENKVNTANTYNDSCEGTYPAPCGQNTTNDFLSCDDGNLETQTYRKNKFTGLHIQAFNSSITNCATIANVSLCYRWWTAGGTSTNCSVAADANGNASYTIINATCPNMVNATCPEASPSPVLVCTDITSLENWTCGSFFGTNGTKAVARTELSTSNPGPSQMLRTDALFFKVIYI